MGNLVWLACSWFCAALFTGFGVYAGRRKNPMWFWSGTEVPPESIRDIPAYNKENRTMWCLYAIPFWVAGVSFRWYPFASAVVLGLACMPGFLWLVWCYNKIEQKYKK